MGLSENLRFENDQIHEAVQEMEINFRLKTFFCVSVMLV